MGRLVLTRFNRRTWKVEQLTLDNVSLTAEYIDEFGRRTTIINLYPNDQRRIQESYVVTEIHDERLIEGIHWNVDEIIRKWWETHEKKKR